MVNDVSQDQEAVDDRDRGGQWKRPNFSDGRQTEKMSEYRWIAIIIDWVAIVSKDTLCQDLLSKFPIFHVHGAAINGGPAPVLTWQRTTTFFTSKIVDENERCCHKRKKTKDRSSMFRWLGKHSAIGWFVYSRVFFPLHHRYSIFLFTLGGHVG